MQEGRTAMECRLQSLLFEYNVSLCRNASWPTSAGCVSLRKLHIVKTTSHWTYNNQSLLFR